LSGSRPGLCRRELLGGAAALAAIGVAGCSGKAATATTSLNSPVTIPRAKLGEGGRLTVMLGKNPVEVRRGPEGVTAVMLRCTHTGCVVRWRPAEKAYVCPCHEGRFGA